MKWFDPERSEGRVVPDGGGTDAVAYGAAVHGAGERTLRAGERIVFDLTFDAAGVRADNICRVVELPAGGMAAADPEAARCACWDAAAE
ncbi:cold-shock protein [Streptomyces sp. NBC_01604]|uniref:cold-shock protein n=1 Tax=Streptomyces sp. NBC_01604 TaxID=2975894 RepID=UPI00386A57ED